VGRLRLVLLREPGDRLREASGRRGLAVRRRHDEARVNNPAFVRAIQDIKDNLANLPADQINADGNTTGFTEFLTGIGSMCAWWGDVGSNAKTNDTSLIGDVVGFDILPGSDDVYNAATGAWDTLPDGPNFAPNNAYIGWGVYVMSSVDADPVRQKAPGASPAHIGGKDVSLWMAAYPRATSRTATATSTWPSGSRPATTRRSSRRTSTRGELLQPPERGDRAADPGIFQYYSAARRSSPWATPTRT
jgi:multiple sugar transport system substrate-binding protein